MYEKFFGFTEPPFKQTPDPQFFYASPTHEDALGMILRGIANREGFMVITGEVGTGKTTVCRRLLEALAPGVKGALIPNPGLTTIELLQSVNQEFGIGFATSSKKELLDELSRFLLDSLRAGGGAVLVIDEAQHLSVECLEEIRLLSNLETTKEKLLQIVLVGQPELDDKLRMNQLRQLTQRIALHNQLRPLSLGETRRYVASRLEVVGWKDRILFTSGAVDRVHALSQGFPRVINFLCDSSLQAACGKETRMIGETLVEEAGRKRPSVAWPVRLAAPALPSRDVGVGGAQSGAPSHSVGVGGAQSGAPSHSVGVGVSPTRPSQPLHSPSPDLRDHRRPRFRVTPVWVALVGFIVIGLAGALNWLAPTWQKVNENLTGAGKAPPVLTVRPGSTSPDLSTDRMGTPTAMKPVLEPPTGVSESMPPPQGQIVQESPATRAGEKAPTTENASGFASVGVQDAKLAATVYLLQRWGRFQSIPFKSLAGRDPSGLIRESGLQSSTVKMELGLLERLDYPCLVEWADKPGGETHAVALLNLGPKEITILDPLVGRRVVDRAEFSRQVRGEALVLWKGLPGIKIPLKPKKDKDPVVAELQRVLERKGRFNGDVKGFYNAKTRAAVTRLQSDFGLKETGLFGSQSYMALAKLVLGSEVPSLKYPLALIKEGP